MSDQTINPYDFTMPSGKARMTLTRDGKPQTIEFDAVAARFFLTSEFKDRAPSDPEACAALATFFKRTNHIDLDAAEQLTVLVMVQRIWEDFKKKLDLREISPLPTASPR